MNAKTKKIRKRGFWRKDSKNHPLIMEVQLGKSVKDIVVENFLDMNFEALGLWRLDLAEVVQEIVKLNDPNIRFAVDIGNDWCQIIVLNRSDMDTGDMDYWDNDDKFAHDDFAYNDCDLLNKIVEKLFGIVHETPKAKITDRQYAKEERCPFCLHKKIVVIDNVTWNEKVEMGCARCGETWYKETKTIVTGFSRAR